MQTTYFSKQLSIFFEIQTPSICEKKLKTRTLSSTLINLQIEKVREVIQEVNS